MCIYILRPCIHFLYFYNVRNRPYTYKPLTYRNIHRKKENCLFDIRIEVACPNSMLQNHQISMNLIFGSKMSLYGKVAISNETCVTSILFSSYMSEPMVHLWSLKASMKVHIPLHWATIARWLELCYYIYTSTGLTCEYRVFSYWNKGYVCNLLMQYHSMEQNVKSWKKVQSIDKIPI